MWKRGRSDSGCEVLVAEDSAHDQLLFALAVDDSETTSKVTFAADGLVLLETLRDMRDQEMQPDVVVLDLDMPRLDGFGALAEIRSDPTLAHLPVVVFSNSTQPSEVRRARSHGASMHVSKPITYDELLSFVDSLGEVSIQPSDEGDQGNDS